MTQKMSKGHEALKSENQQSLTIKPNKAQHCKT